MRADAVPDLVAGVARRRRGGRRRPRLRRASSSRSPDGRRLLRRRPTGRRRGVSRCGAATSWPGCGWRSCTTGRSRGGGLVVGTGNKTESLIGYTTLFGDSACAFNPIGDLYKSQVRQLAAAIGVPEAIIRKAPSADLWPGQTDETEAGFSYPVLDRLLFWRIDKRRSIDELVALGLRPGARRAGRPDGRGRRVQAPGAADRQARAADGRRRLPVPAAAARLARGGDGRADARRRARCTSSRRRSATSATSRSGRSRSCGPCR